ncbi:hypothetical protein [Acinetobacter bouvetii]|uniref:Uracil-DNA glycosylase n=1 Tax=Acinetobacter bouvetii TaxID=202951 RepID=A0A811GGW5_9GAMM|nr:hypothetical protein [Acinetobacter bouvetii]CAB1221344.1 hypothetical protein SFB21_2753 [Acinetobacter bouvetii]
MNINNELKSIYEAVWDNLLKDLYAFEDANEYTAPLLLKFPDDYFKSENKRIMFFGQETRGWQNKIDNELPSIEKIMNVYQRYFIENNMKYRDQKTKKMISRSSFRSGIVNLRGGLKKRNLSIDLIWNNINKIGRHGEKVGVNSRVREIEFEKFNVIPQEIELLKPNFLIFFTGPYRDKEILNKFPNLTIEKHLKFSSKELVLVKNAEGEIVGLRTYHPNYLKGFYSMLEPHCLDIITEVLK